MDTYIFSFFPILSLSPYLLLALSLSPCLFFHLLQSHAGELAPPPRRGARTSTSQESSGAGRQPPPARGPAQQQGRAGNWAQQQGRRGHNSHRAPTDHGGGGPRTSVRIREVVAPWIRSTARIRARPPRGSRTVSPDGGWRRSWGPDDGRVGA